MDMWDGGYGRCLLMPSLHVGGVSTGDARSRGQASCTAAREEEVPFSFALPPIHPWTLRLSCRWVWRAHSSHTGDPRQLCAKEGEEMAACAWGLVGAGSFRWSGREESEERLADQTKRDEPQLFSLYEIRLKRAKSDNGENRERASFFLSHFVSFAGD